MYIKIFKGLISINFFMECYFIYKSVTVVLGRRATSMG
jgi:hypothetical protein